MRLRHSICVFTGVALLFVMACFDKTKYEPKPYIRPLEIVKLSDTVYMHISYLEDGLGGYLPKKGFIRIKSSKAVVIEAPSRDSISQQLIKYVENHIAATIAAVIIPKKNRPSHKSSFNAFLNLDIPVYTTLSTAEKLSDSLLQARITIDSTTLAIEKIKLETVDFEYTNEY